MKPTELKALLKCALEREAETITNFSSSDNPQVIELRLKAEGRVEVLRAVIDYMEDWKVPLKLLANTQ